MAVSSVNDTSTVNALDTALLSVTVKVMASPSVVLTSSTVTAVASSSLIVPVPVSESSTRLVLELNVSKYVSVPSDRSSSVVVMVNVWVSDAVPVKFNTTAVLS